ncbi:MAG: hypothetical protein IPJ68_02145 [Candidatus Moraniibacteriota bacterium]|nr:MAG: hypothetical protein IPJ68_02145 [Candidatus Moranbacteria bacterium]
MDALLHTAAFLLALIGAFFVPGFIWWRAIFSRVFSGLEEIVFSFLTSLAAIDLIMLLLGRFGLPLSLPYVGSSLVFLILLGGAILWAKKPLAGTINDPVPTFTKNGLRIFFVLFALTLLIRTIYLAPNILPTATDLGHHVYWSEMIRETKALPNYEKIEIVVDPATGTATVAPPRGIADFIIGEHLPLAFLSELSSLDFTSAFPILFLHIINLLSVLAVTALAFRVAQPFEKDIRPEYVALFVLLILGPLFALASPQAKFVTGGVVGNLFGNLFIPAVLLLFYRGLHERRSVFIAVGLFFAFILAYTHHLSTLVLAFILAGTIAITALGLMMSKRNFLRDWLRLAFSPAVLSVLLLAGLFMGFALLPTYLDTAAIDSAIGTPTKTTRTGLSFFQVSNSIGMGKVALGVFGILLVLGFVRRRPIESGFVIGWGGILLVMAMYPHLLLLDIPSSRIGSYLAYPLALAAAFALTWLAGALWSRSNLPVDFRMLATAAILVFLVGSGSFDNASSLSTKDRSKELVQTFAATSYLADHADGAMILKDHNYLSADAWMKLSFHRDYGYPLSRGLFGRYEEGGNRRERCTLAMISTPNTAFGEACFKTTEVRYLVVNPEYDKAQFEKSDSFSKLYTSQTAAIFERTEK